MFFVSWDYILFSTVAFAIAYETLHWFRFYVRFAVYISIVLFVSLCIIPIAIFRPGNVHNTVLASYVLRPVLNWLLGMKWHLRNPENFVSEGSIICANHQSCLDFLGMITFWPIMERCAAIAKQELIYVGPFGIGAALCGTIFIKRNKPNDSHSALNHAVEIVKRKRVKLWIFPEGTRGNGEEMLPFKKGAFHMAITAQMPITPVVYSRYHFLDHKTKRFDPGEVIMTVLPPVSTEGMTLDEMPELMEKVRSMMEEVYKKTSAEVIHGQTPAVPLS